jgi:hypothetical protein
MKTVTLIYPFCLLMAAAAASAQPGPAAPFGSAARTMAPDVAPAAPPPNIQQQAYPASGPGWPGSTTYAKSNVGRATAPTDALGQASTPSSAVGWKSAPNGSATAVSTAPRPCNGRATVLSVKRFATAACP